ncbi:MAG: hypothetical protein ABI112_02450 [Terracoccus sp.]
MTAPLSPPLRLAILRRPVTVKVAKVTALFWVAKLLSTGMGEACSDFLFARFGAVGLLGGSVVFVVAMVAQLRSARYVGWLYWSAVSMVAVVGTMAADVIHVGAGIPYAVTTPFFALALTVVFWCWKRAEGTLSIHSINTRRREWFYWAAVMTTFAFGTAAGDLTAITLNLGYLGSVWLFLSVMAVPLVGWRLGLNPIVAFWMAYIVTRPLGASIADWVGKPVSHTGLGWGDGTVTAVLAALFIGVVTVMSRRDAPTGSDRTATTR